MDGVIVGLLLWIVIGVWICVAMLNRIENILLNKGDRP